MPSAKSSTYYLLCPLNENELKIYQRGLQVTILSLIPPELEGAEFLDDQFFRAQAEVFTIIQETTNIEIFSIATECFNISNREYYPTDLDILVDFINKTKDMLE